MTEAELIAAAQSVADGTVMSTELTDADHPESDLYEALGVVGRIRQFIVGDASSDEASPEEASDGGTPSGDAPPAPVTPAPPLRLRDGTPVPAEWGQVRLVERVGEGSFGTVFRAVERTLDLEVALKVLAPVADPAGRRILDEGRRLAAITHPNVVRVYGVDERPPLTALRMEFVRGLTLDDHVRQSGPLDEARGLQVAIDLCRALAALHGNGVVHRDVKASNVMLAADGRTVLMDLGAGISSDDADPSRARFAGTPMYAPPEVLGGAEQTAASDVYAVAMLLFYALTGRYPYESRAVEALVAEKRAGAPRTVESLRADVSRACALVVNDALTGALGSTFPDADVLADALADARAEAWSRVERRTGARGDTPTNLPSPRGDFVGRDRRVGAALRASAGSRLVTFVGPGGAGKTRLAVEAGHALLDEVPGGAWLVDLTPLSAEAERLDDALLEALGVTPGRGQRAVDAATAALAPSPALVIFDNCEHVIEPVSALVSALLTRCPRLRVIATSREPLAIAGESRHDVELMDVPDEGEPSIAAAREIEAVRFFVACGRSVRPSFRLTERNLPAVCTLVRSLDGIPLALELAAMQLDVLSPEAIVSRLDARFHLLRKGRRDAQPHHRALRSLIDWSHDQLSPVEQALFRRLSIFSGTMGLEAVEAIGYDVDEDAFVVDTLFSLVRKSLVETSTDGLGRVRYGMLETIRTYADEKLAHANEREEMSRRHRQHYAGVAEAAAPELVGSNQAEWFERLATDHDNLRRAIERSVEAPDVATGVRLARGLFQYWTVRGHWAEGRQVCETLLGRLDPSDRGADRAGLADWAGTLAYQQGAYDDARAHYRESLSIRREEGAERAIGVTLNNLGGVENEQGNYEAAEAHRRAALEIFRALEDRRAVALTLGNLATTRKALGDFAGACEIYEESLAICRELEDTHSVAIALSNLGMARLAVGDRLGARASLEECLGLARELGEARVIAFALTNLGNVESDAGDHAAAGASHERSLAIAEELGDRLAIAYALSNMGTNAIRADDVENARRHMTRSLEIAWELGSRELVAEALGVLGTVASRQGEEDRATRLRESAEACRRGAAPMSKAVAYALGRDDRA